MHWLPGELGQFPLLPTNTVLTPHPGEAARLLGCSVAQIQTDRPAAAQELAERYGCVAVLKGSGTLIAAPGREMLHNPTGNPGLARGGSGDVLAGMLAALLAQGLAPLTPQPARYGCMAPLRTAAPPVPAS